MKPEQFPPLPESVSAGGLSPRSARMPGWPRLMTERMAADYLSIGKYMLRERGPKPVKSGARSLWDLRDLDRWADALAGRPLDESDTAAQSNDVERQFLEGRRKKGQGNG
jgi:hypothetical protein